MNFDDPRWDDYARNWQKVCRTVESTEKRLREILPDSNDAREAFQHLEQARIYSTAALLWKGPSPPSQNPPDVSTDLLP